MYHVSAVPRPSLGRFLAHCAWFGASRGALYGLIWGAGYGIFFWLIGALFGGPIGLVFGAAVGAIDGLLCGLALYHRSTSITARATAFRCWIGVFTWVACMIGGYALGGGDRLIGGNRAGGVDFFGENNIAVVIIPSLIAGLCGYAAIGRLLRWYERHWVYGQLDHPSRPDWAQSESALYRDEQ